MLRTACGWALLLVIAGGWRLDAQVVLNEIMFDPQGSEFTDEFIELHNIGHDAVELAEWGVGDGDEVDLLVDVGLGTTLPPGAFALVMDSGYFDSDRSYDPLPAGALILTVEDATLGSGGLSNGEPESIYLINEVGDTVSTVKTTGTPQGHSYERVLSGDEAANWAASRWPGGTPGRVNSANPKTYDLAVALVDSVVAVRDGAGRSVAVDVTNAGKSAAGSFTVRSAIGDEEVGAAQGSNLGAGDILRVHVPVNVFRPGIHRGTMTVFFVDDEDPTNDRVTLLIKVSAPPGSVSLTEVMAAPEAGDPEWVEVLNRSSDALDLEGWGLIDRSGIEGTMMASLVVPGGKYGVVTQNASLFRARYPDYEGPLGEPHRWPALNNSGDKVALIDPTAAGVDTVEFGAALAGRSLERVRLDASGGDADNWLSSTDPSGATPGKINSAHFNRALAGLVLEVSQESKGSATTIRYVLPWKRAHANLSVYDSNGNHVRWLLRGSEGGSGREVIWDGLGDGGRHLIAGIYVLLLETRNAQGQTVRLRRPVVIRRGLK